MRLLPKCSACMYQIRYSISLKVKGLNTANNEKKPSVLYQRCRDFSEVEDTVLSPDLSKGSDFSDTDGQESALRLPTEKFEATHKILLKLPLSLTLWRTFCTSATRT